MDEQFTAAQARALAGPTLQEKVDLLLASVKKKAEQRKRKLRTGWDHKEDDDLWLHGGYKNTEEWKEATAILEGLGFKVSFFYNESQFVDMYTLIEW